MKEKICPLTGKACGPHCGWFISGHDKCAMILIGDSLFPLMMSVTGEYTDNPLARIADQADEIDCTLDRLIKSVDSVASNL